MKTQFCLSALLLLGLSYPPQAGAFDPNDKLLKQALQLYNAGHVNRAIPLFLQDLKDNPNNGTAHYYLGMALKERGPMPTPSMSWSWRRNSCLQVLLKTWPKGLYLAVSGRSAS